MKISVILAVYNEDQYLAKCLESLSNQDYKDFEVIVVDDGSRSRIQNSEFRIQNNKELFKFYKINHSGTAVARNFGVQKANGDILVFVDGDMTFEKDFLVVLTEPIREKRAKGTFSTEELVANWNNIWARCWNYENDLYSKKRINRNKGNMKRDFRAVLKTEFDRVKGFDDIGYTDTWSLVTKLGYYPELTTARYYHYNPARLAEVFNQALWIGGRQRKWREMGKLLALIRATIPFSLLFGIIKAIKTKEPEYVVFKTVYDLGILMGILKSTW